MIDLQEKAENSSISVLKIKGGAKMPALWSLLAF